MGHSDEIAIVDANFPASSCAFTAGRQLLSSPGVQAAPLLEATLALLPLDDYVTECAWVMRPVEDPPREREALTEIRSVLDHYGAAHGSLSREDFYSRTRSCFLIVQCGELRRYGNVILKKGVIATD
ncbi:hypothetical protein OHR68_13835 [Spirillospora sp. NBC_00431]